MVRDNSSLATGIENFVNTIPVASATATSATIDSAVTTRCAAPDCGYMAPYPMVPSVCTLKKNASANDPCRAFAIPPVTRYISANTTLSASNVAAMKSRVSDQGAPSSSWYRSPTTSRGAWTTSIPLSSWGRAGEVAMRPSIARARAAWQETELLLVRGVLHVLLDFVLGGARLLLGVAHLSLRVTLRLLGAAVGVQRVLCAVGRVGGAVLDVFRGIALCKRRQRKADCERCDHPLQHVLIPLRRPADGPAVLRQGAHAPFGAQRSGGPPALEAAYRSFGWLPEGAVSTGFCVSVGWPVTSPGCEDIPGSLLAPLSWGVLGAGGRATLPGVP